MYRATSAAEYPLENVNTADLAGVLWYLHREVIVSTPRKYSIDRIRRFKVSVKNTQEFFNVHHRGFGAFLAFDAAKCTTPVCGQVFKQYGFIVGCQVLDPKVAAYRAKSVTSWANCKPGACNLPVWYSLPGPCPVMGLDQEDIIQKTGQDFTGLDVYAKKTPKCLKDLPGGRCDKTTGAPDCTYSVTEAGHIMLDELVGIGNYEDWWRNKHNKEYVGKLDAGVGTHFWDGKHDLGKCAKRVEAVHKLFKQKFPDMPESLPEPPCDFDMYYKGEFHWTVNHTGAAASSFWGESGARAGRL